MTERVWEKLDQAVREGASRADTLQEPAVAYSTEAAGSAVEVVFAQRALRALREVAHEVPEESLTRVVSAPTDLDVLLGILLQPEARLPGRDPLTAARLRGVQASRRMLSEEGGTLSAEEVGELLGISRQAVNQRRQKGQLLALSVGRHGFAYPAWQLVGSRVLPGLAEVLAALASHDPWMQARFFLAPSPRLDDERPLDLLRRGENVERVIAAAESYGEHGAA